MKKSILARNIKKLRMFKSLNQTEFASLFDLNRPTIGSYEEGRSEPKLQTLLKIAHHYKLTVDDLVSKELTVNQIAGFDGASSRKNSEAGLGEKIESLERKISSLEASIRLLVKNKT
jgi:DNA-binding XRE family transcriptional regulator